MAKHPARKARTLRHGRGRIGISDDHLNAVVSRGAHTGCGCAASAARVRAALADPGEGTPPVDSLYMGDAATGTGIRRGSGRLGVDESMVWAMYTKSVYTNSDTLSCAVREMLQNSRDAIDDAVARGILPNAQSGRVTFTWRRNSAEDGTFDLIVEDNGTGMSCTFHPTDPNASPTGILPEKFMVLGGSGKRNSEGSAGGFGAAKAVILGIAQKGWEVRSLNARAYPEGTEGALQYEEMPDKLQGTRITLYGVEWRETQGNQGTWDPAEKRITTQIQGCSFPFDVFAGREGAERRLSYYFTETPGRAPRSINSPESWLPRGVSTSKMKVRVGVLDRPDGTTGRIWVRIKGILQWAQKFYGNVPKDVVVDVSLRGLQPGTPGYPFPVARDSFISGPADNELDRVQRFIQDETASGTKEDEWTVLDPDSDDGNTRSAALGYGKIMSGIFDELSGTLDELAEAAANIARAEGMSAGLAAPLSVGASDAPEGGTTRRTQGVVPEGMEGFANAVGMARALESREREDTPANRRQYGNTAGYDDVASPALAVRIVSEAANAAGVAFDFSSILVAAERGTMTADDADMIADAIETVGRSRSGRSDSRVPQSSMARVLSAAAKIIEPSMSPERKKKSTPNPWGAAAAVHCHKDYGKKNAELSSTMSEDQQKKAQDVAHKAAFRAFYRNPKKHMATLLLWDLATRLVATAVRTIPAFGIGFLLEDGVAGRGGGSPVRVLINPDFALQRIEAYKSQPQTIALYFYEMACHELAHVLEPYARHTENFSTQREAIANNSSAVVPLLEEAVVRILKLKPTRVPASLLARSEKTLEGVQLALDAQIEKSADLHSKLNRAQMDRDVAQREAKAAQDRIVKFESSTPQQSALRVGALAAVVEYRLWLLNHAGEYGWDRQKLAEAFDGNANTVAGFLLGEGSMDVMKFMHAIGD